MGLIGIETRGADRCLESFKVETTLIEKYREALAKIATLETEVSDLKGAKDESKINR